MVVALAVHKCTLLGPALGYVTSPGEAGNRQYPDLYQRLRLKIEPAGMCAVKIKSRHPRDRI
jgi:hypothetical protein